MAGQNIADMQLIESENYTYAYPAAFPEDVQMVFPRVIPTSDVVRERPTAPLRERSESEKARLLNHPFFSID